DGTLRTPGSFTATLGEFLSKQEATHGSETADHLSVCHNGISEFSNSDILLPEVCISSNSNSFEEDMNYEVQQAYKIFSGFLLDKYKGLTSPFFHPTDDDETQDGIEGVQGQVQSQLGQSMCLQRIKEKFINKEYETITEFVADFRLILENCYRCHGVDHWISKQGQKLEIMLEQKLTLLSRPLREKTTLAVTSKGRFGNDEERGSGSSSTRRRLAPRSLTTITVGGHESVMVQALRLEEQQRAKEEKRQRELEKKEAGEMSAKEVEEWEQSLLLQALPQTVDTVWELPAIGHFLCLAQTALNLPEIVFFELERCLLMPRCSLLLSKVMSSLLSPPHRRATLHRRPTLPYRRWESELRQRVSGWYRTVGSARNQQHRAEQLGLCNQFFWVLGEESPLEDTPFHLLPFYQRVWLLKGLCDHVYETQKDVQDTVLAQPIHECRESILGYDSKENAYIHFPHFCGADLRIYCQQPSSPPAFPFPSKLVKRLLELIIEGTSPIHGNKSLPCSDCWKKKIGNVASAEHTCACEKSNLATKQSPRNAQNSADDLLNDKMWTKKRKHKKEHSEERLLKVKKEDKPLQQEDRLFQTKASKSVVSLVCTNLGELRELISKIEDELDDMESTKKRLGRWFNRREAVKDLHSTLIRLLNELTPWEPKLVKAYHRNRFDIQLFYKCNFITISVLFLANTREFDAEKTATRTPQNHLKPHLSCSEMSNVTSAELRGDSVSQLTSSVNQCRDLAWATTSPILHPTSGLPKGYTPIPTLLAKSVGNKVTLMKRPPDGQSVAFSDGQSKRLLVSPSSAVSTVSHISNAQSSSMSSQQNLQQIKTQSQQQAQILGQKNSRISMNTFVSSDVDQNAAEKQIQQLVILPSNLLVKKTEAKSSSSNPQQSKGIHVGGSKVTSPIFISTDVSGFTIPETKIPVQRVPPLKDAKTMKTAPPVVSHLSLGSLSKGGSKGICNVQVSMPQGGVSAPSPITTISSAVLAEMAKPTDSKQELKTVCIRDSKSILVTTRGGNTGIVKVQTSSDQNALGSFPTCPVITISPQFKAFLISKTSSALSDPSTFQVSTTSVPTEASAPVTQNMVSNVPSTATSSVRMADPSSIPVRNSENQTKGSVGALSQDSGSSVGSAVKAKMSQSTAGSLLPISRSKNPVTSSISSSGNPQPIPRETTRTGVTPTSTDERSCANKYILVNSSSSSNSTVVSPKSPPSSTKPVPGTRVTFVPQPSPTNFTGSSPKLVIGVSSSGWTSTTSFLSQTPNIGSGPTQPVAGISSEALFNIENIAMSSGNSPTQNVSPISVISSKKIATSNATALPTGNLSKSNLSIPANILSTISAQTTTPFGGSTAQTPPFVTSSNPLNIKFNISEEKVSSLTPQFPQTQNKTPLSIASTTCTQSSTSDPGTVQQKIILNTATPLTAGTQIVLNNARFVIPPQGLGPGSHVFIITSPAPQVPVVSSTGTGPSAVSKVVSSDNVSSLASILPQTAAKRTTSRAIPTALRSKAATLTFPRRPLLKDNRKLIKKMTYPWQKVATLRSLSVLQYKYALSLLVL
uniref:Bromo domain-containing protein n=1 Tax=Oryzias latipes TaxID=8090 RepID=A0A3P9IZ77_ORYLA